MGWNGNFGNTFNLWEGEMMHTIAATILSLGTAQACYFALALAAEFFGRSVEPLGTDLVSDAVGGLLVFGVSALVYSVIMCILHDIRRL